MKGIFLVLILFVNVSCSRRSATDQVMKVMQSDFKKQIKFHEKMTPVKNERDVNENYYILHYFSADCDKCINRLRGIKEFMDKNKDLPVDYKFIFTAPTDYFVNQALKNVNIEYPIYWDKEFWGFQIVNGIPIDEPKYETMLLNKNNELILYGHFFDNPKAYDLLKNFLNENR